MAPAEATKVFFRKSGEEVWRYTGVTKAWCTPVIVDAPGGQEELVISSEEVLFALDPKTGKAGVSRIDTSTDSYKHAVSLQTRVTADDLADDDRLAAIAAAAGLSPDESRRRYAPF